MLVFGLSVLHPYRANPYCRVWVLPDDQLPRRVSTDDMMTEIISGNTAVG